MQILSVGQLTTAIKKHLESTFHTVVVKGEIINLKEQASGHLYFTLKDAEAQISAVLFRGNSRELSRLPKNGDQVVIHGEVSVYPPRGAYQLIARKLEYQGVGQLLLRLQQLKEKLAAQGWFDKAAKKPLPPFPKTIGVVTSPTGSVIQDILQILSRRFKGFHLILSPVKVQGDGAAEEIAAAIDAFNQHRLADILIVGRGGGSLEDLWAFNEECVAAAIYRSKIPVISAVGHETDFSIADFVADVRAPTPSAAAEIATQETAQLLQRLSESRARLHVTVETAVRHQRRHLEALRRNLYSPTALLGPHWQRVDSLREDLDTTIRHGMTTRRLSLSALQRALANVKPSSQIAACRQRLLPLQKGIEARAVLQVQQKKERLSQLTAHLRGIDPKNLLQKGYCILFKEKKDSVILSAHAMQVDEKVSLLLHDGTATLTVEEIQR
ncbi:MAG: exodeoxyribonuclease VII large subunit [Verrucomicrobia bacterium]|nr:exodeoxyribonuclease VII large subunit [Verrucomicrobiota bacterium]